MNKNIHILAVIFALHRKNLNNLKQFLRKNQKVVYCNMHIHQRTPCFFLIWWKSCKRVIFPSLNDFEKVILEVPRAPRGIGAPEKPQGTQTFYPKFAQKVVWHHRVQKKMHKSWFHFFPLLMVPNEFLANLGKKKGDVFTYQGTNFLRLPGTHFSALWLKRGNFLWLSNIFVR